METLEQKAEHITDVLLIIGANVQGRDEIKNIILEVLDDNLEQVEELESAVKALRKIAQICFISTLILAAVLLVKLL